MVLTVFIGFGLEIWSMLFSASLPFALYWFKHEGNWYLQVNLIYSWLCEGSIYLGERIMYISFAFEIVGLKFKKLVMYYYSTIYDKISII